MARLIRWLLIALLMLPATAYAAPVVIAVIAYGASSLATYLGYSAAAAAFIGALAATAASAVIANNMKPGQQQGMPTFQSESKDRQTVVRSAVEPRRIVYGRVAVSGPLVYAESTGPANNYLHLIIPVAGHEVEAIDQVYFNDEALPLDENGWAMGRWAKFGVDTLPISFNTTVPTASPWIVTMPEAAPVVASVHIENGNQNIFLEDCTPLVPGRNQFSRLSTTEIMVSSFAQEFGSALVIDYFRQVSISDSYVRVRKHLGAADQVADADLVSESNGNWTNNHRLRGVAYLYIRLEFSADVFPTGVPNIKAVVRGKKVTDPRTSPPSVAWSDNWALIVRDYLTADYGLDCDDDEVDDDLIIAAANICDETVDLDGSPPTATQARYTANGTVNLSDRPVDILRSLVTGGAGAAVFSEGKWKGYAGAYTTPTVDIDEDWLRGPVKARARPPRRELFNGVKGVISSAERFWQPTDFPQITNSTYEAQDGGQRILRDIELPYTTDSVRAQRIAKIYLESARQAIIVELPCNVKAFQVAAWDTVRLSLERLGWTDKVFRVLDWKFSPEGGVDLVLKEEAAGVYDWAFGDASDLDFAPDTSIHSPFSDIDITIGTPTSGTDELFVAGDGTVVPRIRLPFTQPANPLIRYFEVQFAKSAGSPQLWQDAPDVAAPADQAFIFPVDDGIAYDGRIRAVTSLGNAGAWSTFRGHTVVGKTEAPSDVSNAVALQNGDVVIFGCDTVDDADLDSIEVRWLDAGDTEWNNGIPVANILRGQQFPSASIPQGDWTFLFKAKDTSGNYSATADRADVTITADGFTSITSREDAPDWPGAKTNFVVSVSGALIPDSTLLASQHTNAELFEQFVPYPQATCTYTAPELDKGRDGSARIYADIISALGPGVVTGTSAPKHQVDYRTAAGAYDGYEDWTIGGANFRYASSQIVLDTSVGKAKITGFSTMIDKKTRTETGTFSVGAGGSQAVSFADGFHGVPVLVLTPQGSGDVAASYTDLTETGFTGYFKTAGVAGAGTVSYQATGA